VRLLAHKTARGCGFHSANSPSPVLHSATAVTFQQESVYRHPPRRHASMYLRPEILFCAVLILLILLLTTRYRQLEMGDVSVLFPLQLLQPAKSIVMGSLGTKIQTTINDVLYLVVERPLVGASIHITSHATDSLIPATIINVEQTLIDRE
jgi:hypothetical protein